MNKPKNLYYIKFDLKIILDLKKKLAIGKAW